MATNQVYEETVTSWRTQSFFAALTLLFLLLAIWRAAVLGWDALAIILALLCAAVLGWDALAIILALLCAVFLFYTGNYRALVIRITLQALTLTFGIFRWVEQFDNIAACAPDDPPWLNKYGGAGIHFMTVRGRYRASINLLEHPRVSVQLKRKRGLVRDVSFSTRQPDEIVRIIEHFRART